jgi:hypothetical protein
LVCAVAAALGNVMPVDAATKRRELCVKRATLRDSPHGFTIGYLHRPETVQVVHYAATGRWASVRVRTGRSGWLLTSSFCRVRR